MNDPWEIWKNDKTVARDVREAGYRFYSTGRWYRKGTEAVLLFTLSQLSNLESVEKYVNEGTDGGPNSGLFGGDRKTGKQPDWDEEGCSFKEFDIYKDGVLVREGEEWREHA